MTPDRVSEALRTLVIQRAGGCCEYCRSQARFAMQAFSIEHIEPRSADGPSGSDNLALGRID
jgi:hypothetical protein